MRFSLILVAAISWSVTDVAAQTLQLPTFRSFGYSGSVLVPDGGSASLGGIGRASEFGSRGGWGPLRSRTTGRTMSTGSLSAHVQIIDLAEMDRQLLGAEPAEFLRRQKAAEATNDGPLLPEVREAPTDPVEAAKQLVRDARRCVSKGNFRVADYYYRRSIQELPADLAVIAKQEYSEFLTQRATSR
ncbi:MAG: hypothetical protein R3C05_24045 [Pirellulaceae bacterium]